MITLDKCRSLLDKCRCCLSEVPPNDSHSLQGYFEDLFFEITSFQVNTNIEKVTEYVLKSTLYSSTHQANYHHESA